MLAPETRFVFLQPVIPLDLHHASPMLRLGAFGRRQRRRLHLPASKHPRERMKTDPAKAFADRHSLLSGIKSNRARLIPGPLANPILVPDEVLQLRVRAQSSHHRFLTDGAGVHASDCTVSLLTVHRRQKIGREALNDPLRNLHDLGIAPVPFQEFAYRHHIIR